MLHTTCTLNFIVILLHVPCSAFQGKTGPHIASVTCADTLTMQRAEKEPQKFDLIRNRMGGWSNFFCAMFTEHQKQHERRPMYAPHQETTEED